MSDLSGKIVTGRRPQEVDGADLDAYRVSRKAGPFSTLSVVFPVACVLAQTFIFDLFEVTYNNIRLQGDIASYQLYKNNSAVTLPVKLTDKDELTIEITKNDFLNAGSVELYT